MKRVGPENGSWLEEIFNRELTRREFLRGAAIVTGGAILVACVPQEEGVEEGTEPTSIASSEAVPMPTSENVINKPVATWREVDEALLWEEVQVFREGTLELYEVQGNDFRSRSWAKGGESGVTLLGMRELVNENNEVIATLGRASSTGGVDCFVAKLSDTSGEEHWTVLTYQNDIEVEHGKDRGMRINSFGYYNANNEFVPMLSAEIDYYGGFTGNTYVIDQTIRDKKVYRKVETGDNYGGQLASLIDVGGAKIEQGKVVMNERYPDNINWNFDWLEDGRLGIYDGDKTLLYTYDEVTSQWIEEGMPEEPEFVPEGIIKGDMLTNPETGRDAVEFSQEYDWAHKRERFLTGLKVFNDACSRLLGESTQVSQMSMEEFMAAVESGDELEIGIPVRADISRLADTEKNRERLFNKPHKLNEMKRVKVRLDQFGLEASEAQNFVTAVGSPFEEQCDVWTPGSWSTAEGKNLAVLFTEENGRLVVRVGSMNLANEPTIAMQYLVGSYAEVAKVNTEKYRTYFDEKGIGKMADVALSFIWENLLTQLHRFAEAIRYTSSDNRLETIDGEEWVVLSSVHSVPGEGHTNTELTGPQAFVFAENR